MVSSPTCVCISNQHPDDADYAGPGLCFESKGFSVPMLPLHILLYVLFLFFLNTLSSSLHLNAFSDINSLSLFRKFFFNVPIKPNLFNPTRKSHGTTSLFQALSTIEFYVFSGHFLNKYLSSPTPNCIFMRKREAQRI